ncbi:hypothetical protein K504DRAFT_6834 [Pleomassaria siparia CBS 279.74]|uniref:Uncharacterized protein n=1 Tax=Pleomassaria siparia CBS 279.74 TaxID=1314801 RepID=A0A6G1KP78_9PLEO|nr:hypothetical protein K504DRAFT_6834 [Pleomassaria siparia CBS 279.74]
MLGHSTSRIPFPLYGKAIDRQRTYRVFVQLSFRSQAEGAHLPPALSSCQCFLNLRETRVLSMSGYVCTAHADRCNLAACQLGWKYRYIYCKSDCYNIGPNRQAFRNCQPDVREGGQSPEPRALFWCGGLRNKVRSNITRLTRPNRVTLRTNLEILVRLSADTTKSMISGQLEQKLDLQGRIRLRTRARAKVLGRRCHDSKKLSLATN